MLIERISCMFGLKACKCLYEGAYLNMLASRNLAMLYFFLFFMQVSCIFKKKQQFIKIKNWPPEGSSGFVLSRLSMVFVIYFVEAVLYAAGRS